MPTIFPRLVLLLFLVSDPLLADEVGRLEQPWNPRVRGTSRSSLS